MNYRLTEKGIDLAPVLLELLIWGARHEETGAPCDLIVEHGEGSEAVSRGSPPAMAGTGSDAADPPIRRSTPARRAGR